MDLDEYKGSFVFKSSSSFSHSFIPNRRILEMFTYSYRQYTEVHISNFGVVIPLGENLDFFSPLGFDIQTNYDHKTQKIKLFSVRALKCYLDEKNLIHGRVMATISKFSPQIFETYFKIVGKVSTKWNKRRTLWEFMEISIENNQLVF